MRKEDASNWLTTDLEGTGPGVYGVGARTKSTGSWQDFLRCVGSMKGRWIHGWGMANTRDVAIWCDMKTHALRTHDYKMMRRIVPCQFILHLVNHERKTKCQSSTNLGALKKRSFLLICLHSSTLISAPHGFYPKRLHH